jgi:hypothetical protein
MQMVGKILDEIEKLKRQDKLISDIANKMSEDEEIGKFMFQKLNVDQKSMQEIATTLSIRRFSLEEQLRKAEVDIN